MSSDAFRDNGLVKQIQTALHNAVTLDITTTVGPVDYSLSTAKPVETGTPGMHTSIGLASGDIVTQIDPAFAEGGQYASMRAFHLSREQQGQAIVQQNIATMKELLAFVWELVDPKNPHDAGGSTS